MRGIGARSHRLLASWSRKGCLALGCAVVMLALVASVANAAFPGRNGRIAYETWIGGGDSTEWSIYSLTPSGKREKELVRGGIRPAYSPNGRWIGYVDAFEGGVWMVRASGRGRSRRLSSGLDLDWAPTGGRYVFEERSDGSGLRIYHRHRSRRLTVGRDPAWSSRNKICFFRDDGLYVIRPDGTGLRRLSSHRAFHGGTEADWSPDGRWIVSATVGGSIVKIRVDGSGFRRLVRGDNSAPSFSPDGTRIVFARDTDIVVMRANGTQRRRIASANGDGVVATDWQPLPRAR